MTIVEALKALREGKKVRNKIWEEHEYIMLKNGFIKYGNGVTHRIDIYGEYDMCDDTWEEYKEEVLDEKEKEYLGAVIKPFRDRITYIAKVEEDIHWFYWIMIRIDIGFLNDYYDFCLPPFEETSSMYKNMEVGKEYTLKELGL